jgi:hypothetical protein
MYKIDHFIVYKGVIILKSLFLKSMSMAYQILSGLTLNDIMKMNLRMALHRIGLTLVLSK